MPPQENENQDQEQNNNVDNNIYPDAQPSQVSPPTPVVAPTSPSPTPAFGQFDQQPVTPAMPVMSEASDKPKRKRLVLILSICVTVILLAIGGFVLFIVTRPQEPVPTVAYTVTSTTSAQNYVRPWVGYYQPSAASDTSLLVNTETATSAYGQVVHFFIGDGESFPLSRAQNIINHGSIPLITLEFNKTISGGPASITAGAQDAYLTQFAKSAKAFGYQVWLRPFHEMNGNWYPWSGTGPGTPSDVVAAWKHVKNIFSTNGATNVKFVWSPNADSVPNTSANSISQYWPGDQYVDYAAIDAYNFGTSASWSRWQTIGVAMGTAYSVITNLTTKPIFLAETSSVEQGGSKAAWIADFFNSIRTRYTRIVGVVWFNQNKTPNDWRIDSTLTSLAAFKTEVSKGLVSSQTLLSQTLNIPAPSTTTPVTTTPVTVTPTPTPTPTTAAPITFTITQTPGNKAANVPINVTATLKFNIDLNPTTVNSNNFKLFLYKRNSEVESTVSYDATTRTVSIKPNKLLLHNSQYYIGMSSQVSDNNGNHVASWDYSNWSEHWFRTVKR